MWDANLVTRVRDRKLNEIMIFASMAKIDSANVDTYIDIIVSLGDDIDACDTLLDTDGEANIELDVIDAPEYVSRLSDTELADEEAFNSLKSAPSEDYDEEMLEYVRGLIREAAETIAPEPKEDEEKQALMDEVRTCNARIDALTAELQVARDEASAASQQMADTDAGLREANERIESSGRRIEEIIADLEAARGDALAAEDRLAEREATIKSLKEELEASKSKIDSIASELDAARLEAKTAREQLASKDSLLSNAQEEILAGKRRVEAITAELEAAKGDALTAKDQLLAKDEGIKSVTEELQTCRSRLESLSKELETARGEAQSAKDELAKVEAERSRLADEAEGLGSVMEELKACRSRIDSMSSDLEFARDDAQTAKDQLAEAEAERDRLSKESDDLRAKLASVRTELVLSEQKLSALEAAFQSAADEKGPEPESVPATEQPGPKAELPLEPPAEEPAAPEQVKDDVQAPAEPEKPADAPASNPIYLSQENVDVVRRVRKMKDEKIDQLLDQAAGGKLDLDVCDDIVSFLKTDISICDAILSIDFTDRASVVQGFRKIISVLEESGEPKHQDEYVATLSLEEALLEYSYAQVLNSLQGMMLYLRDEITD